jgi:hypothetical protein
VRGGLHLTVAAVLAMASCRLGFGPGDDAPQGVDDALPAPVDAPRTMPPGDAGTCDPVACSAAGGACITGACELVASSEAALACPAGMPCRLVCEGYRFCREGASCAGAPWCEVACLGFRACQTGVSCGTAQCQVACLGEEACEGGITVEAGGTCTARCCGIEACNGGTSTCTLDTDPCE